MLIRLFNPNDLISCGGDMNQSKSVSMMLLNVVGNIDQSNFRHLHGSLRVSMGGLHGSLQVVSTGLCGSPQVVWWQGARQMTDWFGGRGQGK